MQVWVDKQLVGDLVLNDAPRRPGRFTMPSYFGGPLLTGDVVKRNVAISCYTLQQLNHHYAFDEILSRYQVPFNDPTLVRFSDPVMDEERLSWLTLEFSVDDYHEVFDLDHFIPA